MVMCLCLGAGTIASEVIDAKKLIDQHYYAIASKATILKPNQLNVPKDKFLEKFAVAWDDALAKGDVFNALDACTHLALKPLELGAVWSAHCSLLTEKSACLCRGRECWARERRARA